ncbi:MAG: esterase-like activity of phytase family protein [Rhodoplanes sp.]
MILRLLSKWRWPARLAVLGLVAAAGPVQPLRSVAEPIVAPNRSASVDVRARAIDAFKTNERELRQFGRLEFRGGVELTSSSRDFGGLSGLRMGRDGAQFVAITDKGNWFTGRIVYDGARPAGIAEAAMAPMLDAGGQRLAARGWYDTEGIADDGQGTLYVGIERVNRIVKFDFARQGVLARAEPIRTSPAVQTLPNNRGIEALAFVPKAMPLAGTLIAFSERGLDSAGNTRAFLIGGPAPGGFTVRRTDDFDISDCALLPSGDLLLLERRFSWTSGVAIRLRRIALASIAPGGLVDGPILLFADMGYQVDNMEALGVHRTPQGETVLTLLSDDNFSALQRTLLLQFTLLDE